MEQGEGFGPPPQTMQDLYRCPGAHADKIDPTVTWDTVCVEEEEVPAMLKAGWHPSIADAWASKAAGLTFPAVPSDDAPPTREELERKAKELGIKFDGRTGDKRLATLIAEAV